MNEYRCNAFIEADGLNLLCSLATIEPRLPWFILNQVVDCVSCAVLHPKVVSVFITPPPIIDENDYEIFSKILLDNEVISSINELKVKDNYNISKLINNYTLTQGQYIVIGNKLEEIIKNFIKKIGINVLPIKNVTCTNSDGEVKNIQLDLVFIIDDCIHYFEIKTNLNLDSEKNKATYDKINLVTEEFKKIYPDKKVYGKLLSTWFSINDVTKINKINITFMEELFDLIGVKIGSEEYYNLMKLFGSKLISNRV